MPASTADEENAFHFANAVFVSSTVSPAVILRRPLNANAVPPGRQLSSQSSSRPAGGLEAEPFYAACERFALRWN